ncbi:malonate decarboxylase holo-[acyl-carrier-protein] synthase [Acetobacter thailandicus]|uniref:Malonate decarboxylase holo-[acyl-carrier-protein] synthase n=1 Tax=Acetobacter thailandicus TaxID=1502842 RepID=A0ABT3QCP3_9PROT|nr:malonate decarboxylase holo-[acyl-carrier-protein] synthase [Acetobacter thailandicus]MCX2563062.1 malonate decarboxylase holo-[acyl-carrier-protein] synthase [Acetobacter thailandicus]NHN95780.1 malonate decarboxylase holo-[acyl-carrier-protein] synthase [Acetobacter thailandicus]
MLPLWRHRLLVVRPDVWPGICADTLKAPGNEAIRPVVSGWGERGWPLICRRPFQSELKELAAGGVAVGLPLPPAMGKQRLSFIVPCSALSAFSGKLWPDQTTSAPGITSARQEDISALFALGARHNIQPEATGSLLWETLTGLAYLSETSDFDVVWRLSHLEAENPDALRAFLHDLSKTACKLSVRLDGEIIFPDYRAVQWQELITADPDDEVLVKTLFSVALMPLRSLTDVRENMT